MRRVLPWRSGSARLASVTPDRRPDPHSSIIAVVRAVHSWHRPRASGCVSCWTLSQATQVLSSPPASYQVRCYGQGPSSSSGADSEDYYHHHDPTGDGGDASRGHREQSSAYEQFQHQRSAYHKHSFHEKGQHPGRTARQGETQDEGTDADGAFERGGAWQGRPSSATAQERRQMSSSWENAFFGRVHYEEGMHDRFQRAVDAEEHERLASKTNAELFPDWPPDEEAPLHLFTKLTPALQLRYILNRLAMGERRVIYAVDYGSLSMMYQLNLGESMVTEAESLLEHLGWMNDELRDKIDEVRNVATKVKYDYDLD